VYHSFLNRVIDAHGDLLRGLQVVESAASITTTLLGDKLEGPGFSSPSTSLLMLLQLARTWTPRSGKFRWVCARASHRSTSLREFLPIEDFPISFKY